MHALAILNGGKAQWQKRPEGNQSIRRIEYVSPIIDSIKYKEFKIMEEIRILTNDNRDDFLDLAKVRDFGSQLRGSIILPDSELYEAARRLWNGIIDKKPALIVRPRGVADVIDSVTFAREHNMKLTVRGGGHNVAGRAMLDDGMVIDLSLMKSVRVDPEKRTAIAEGGTTLGDLDHETQAFGLSAPVGIVSETGIAGLTLHGGMGWLLRKHGLTIDNFLSFDVVTADGRLLKANNKRNSDLFWALRGGGGNFGVVTSFEYQLHPVGPDVWLVMVMYPLDKAGKALRFYRDYMSTATEDLSVIAFFWSVPEVPEIPEKFHGAPTFIFLACYTGPFETGEEVIKPPPTPRS
jgi:FAD/FMN-containing dehydrogenase